VPTTGNVVVAVVVVVVVVVVIVVVVVLQHLLVEKCKQVSHDGDHALWQR